MWNDADIVWSHFWKVYNSEEQRGLKLIPKLTLEHVQLTPYSVMTVKLATQILSQSMANVINTYFPVNMHKTAELCEFADKFFDCLNVRNTTEGKISRKDFLHPY